MGLLNWLFGPRVDEVEVTEVRTLLAQGAALIDVREPHEWAAGHVKEARLVPMGNLDRELSKWRPERPLLFICRTGHRAARATDRAQRRGFKAMNVKGGMIEWTRAGLPLKNGRR
jgi:rhodanese-related sulfurtransferase